MLEEGGIVGIFVGLPVNVRFAVENAGVDLRERVEEGEFAAHGFFEGLGSRVDLYERSRSALDGLDDRRYMRVLLGSGKDRRCLLGKGLFQCGFRGGGNQGLEVAL